MISGGVYWQVLDEMMKCIIRELLPVRSPEPYMIFLCLGDDALSHNSNLLPKSFLQQRLPPLKDQFRTSDPIL